MRSSVDCCVFADQLVQWVPIKANKPQFLLCALSSPGVLYIEMGAGKGFLWCVLCPVLAQHSTGSSHRLLMLPFASANGFLQCESLDWSGEPRFFFTEKPGVQMQRDISLLCRVFLFS